MSFLTTAPFQPRLRSRMLVACVLASLGLHAALLALPGLSGHPLQEPFLTATLLRAPAARPVPQPKRARTRPPREHQAPRRHETPRRHEARRRHEAAPGRRAARPLVRAHRPSAPKSVAAVVPPRSAHTQPAWAAGPPSATAVPHAAEESGGKTAAPILGGAAPRPSAGPPAASLEQYRAALMGAAKRYKRYPFQAVENGWAGKVDVRLAVTREGGVDSVRVKGSSGYGILDDQALHMIRKAESVTPIPPALQDRAFSVDIPVVFELQAG